MIKKFTILLGFFIIQSCGLIEINGNGYRYLKYVSKSHIEPFESSYSYDVSDNQSCFKVFEIKNDNIQTAIKSNDITWIHLWKPYCGNESCTNIKQYSDLRSNFEKKGVHLLFVSVTYDINRISKYIKEANFQELVYVLDNDYYGSKTKLAYQKLHLDLDPQATKDDYFFYDNYLFSGDQLIYKGKVINDSIISSYLMN